MFDIEKEEMQEVAPDWENADWEQITDQHAKSGAYTVPVDPKQIKKEAFSEFYEKRYRHRKDHVAVQAARYAILSIGLGALAYIVRGIPVLAVILGSLALILGYLAAYGVGKYREM